MTTTRIEPMRWWHIGPVARLEREVFGADAWSEELFWSELAQAALRHYLVGLSDVVGPGDPVGLSGAHDRPAGYGGLAVYAGESYIQTLAVAPTCRRTGLGARLLAELLATARAKGATGCVLEVRTDNEVAQALYDRFGFRVAGIRRGYYQPSGADALVMTAEGIATPGYGRFLDNVLRRPPEPV